LQGTILVTGANGFLGRSLCQRLHAIGQKIRALVRGPGHDQLLNDICTEVVTGDIREEKVIERSCKGVVGIFHLAAIVQKAGIQDSEFYDIHVNATKTLLDYAIKYNVSKVVHCSTIGVLGHIEKPPADETAPFNAEDIYQVTKAEAEKVVLQHYKEHKTPVTIVRPTAIYGPGDKRLLKLFKMILNGKFHMVGNGNTFIHPVYVDDLIDGMLLAYENSKSEGEIYIIGGAKYITLNEWVSIIGKTGGTVGSRFSIPYLPVQLGAILCEAICKPFGIEPPLFRRRVDFFIKNRAFSIEKARRELCYNPSVDLSEGARKTISWYKKHGWVS